MSQTIKGDKKILILSIVVAATTVIAGILHIQMAPRALSQNLGEGVFFFIGGLVQIFWAVPVMKKWGRIWQIIGIAGTGVLIVLWYVDRIHLVSSGGGMPAGGPQNHQPGGFPRGNMTGGGGFPRGVPPGGGHGIQIGRILPTIEMFQIAFIGLYVTLGIIISKKKKDSKQV